MPSTTTTHESEQNVLNKSFNRDTGLLQVEAMGTDGVGSRVETSKIVNIKITTAGDVTYVGKAKPGTAQSSATWQCKKIDSTDANNVTITWAGGGSFNQVATDLSALTYA